MFDLRFTKSALAHYEEIERDAGSKQKSGKKGKSAKQAGLCKQVRKALSLLRANPKHPSLHTHEYDSIENPYDKDAKVFEAYAQNNTPGAYRIFWCYGPEKNEITIIAITPHP